MIVITNTTSLTLSTIAKTADEDYQRDDAKTGWKINKVLTLSTVAESNYAVQVLHLLHTPSPPKI